MIAVIKQKVQERADWIKKIRRQIHSHPELSFQEHETMAFVAKELDTLGIPYRKNVAETGIVALISGKNPEKKCIALRADMDALPIVEKNDVEYKSKNEGVMHACGHDVHTACLLGAASVLNELKDEFEGTIKLIFQPGEEKSPGGASLMIKDKALENPKPAGIIALHVFPEQPAGIVGFKSGMYMASADELHIKIKGKGGHAALPNKTIDPIVIAANLVVALQQIVSRKADPTTPTVISFGKISGGNSTNVIPDEVELLGTVRTFDEKWRLEILDSIRKICKAQAESFGATIDIEIPSGYPTLFNDPSLTEKTKNAAVEFLGKEQVIDLEMRMTSEDFSFYTQEIPGCFLRLGTNKDNSDFTQPVHNPHFDINEEALSIGAGLMAYAAIKNMT